MKRLALACLLIPALGAAGEPPRYDVVPLEIEQIYSSSDLHLNNNGDVLGIANGTDRMLRVRRANGTYEDLGFVLPGYQGMDGLLLMDFNNSDEVVGFGLFGSQIERFSWDPVRGFSALGGGVALSETGLAALDGPIGTFNVREQSYQWYPGLSSGTPIITSISDAGVIGGAKHTGASGILIPYLFFPDETVAMDLGEFQSGYVGHVSESGLAYGGRFHNPSMGQTVVWNPDGSVNHVRNERFVMANDHGDMVFSRPGNGNASSFHLSIAGGAAVPIENLLPEGSIPNGLNQILELNNRKEMIVRSGSPTLGFDHFLIRPVPEPATLAVLGLGLLPFLRRRVGRGPR